MNAVSVKRPAAWRRHGPACMMALGAAMGVFGAPVARAQENSTLIEPAIPLDYDRGRNVSVVDRQRPDYDPLGIRRGSFLIFPRIDLGLGASDNVFLSSADRQADAYAALAPSVRAQSDWGRHALMLSAGGRFRRYFDFPRRNVDEWYVNGLGRFDIGSSFSLTAEGQAARTQEDPFSGATESNIAALSAYRRNLAAIRGEYKEGRVRAVLAYDYQDFTFSNIELTNGTFVSQANRDRQINRVTGQLEYAFSPSVAAYTQLSYLGTSYSTQLSPGVANRDSDGYRAIVGFSTDVSGFYRGIIGIGYSQRDFKSPLYKNVGGFSAEAQLEYFPSELTTFTLRVRRAIEDSNIGILSAYFDNRASIRVDHELLRNLILNAGAEYARQDYIGSLANDDIWRLRGGGRYLVSRTVGIQADLSYGNRRRTGDVTDFTISELAGALTLVLQR